MSKLQGMPKKNNVEKKDSELEMRSGQRSNSELKEVADQNKDEKESTLLLEDSDYKI